MTPSAYVRLENDTLCVEVDKQKKMQVPLHHIGSVVCFGDVVMSSGAMHRCADDGRSVVLLDRNGRFKARIEGSVSGNILLRQAQFRKAEEEAFSLDVAKAIIAGKLRNARQVLLRGARESANNDDQKWLAGGAESLAISVRNIRGAENLDALRGIEGDAAKNYFSSLSYLIRRERRDAFKMNGRSRRPPRDRFNALLSFIYSMVMNDCRSAIESVGLDPQLGFLHVVRPGRAALALDLMEEFRAILADRLALTLVNRAQVNEESFDERPGGAMYLHGDARKTVVVAYQERKQEEVLHPLLESKIPIGLLPQLQARFLARTIRGEMEGYIPYLYK